jgi:hypothetical protein
MVPGKNGRGAHRAGPDNLAAALIPTRLPIESVSSRRKAKPIDVLVIVFNSFSPQTVLERESLWTPDAPPLQAAIHRVIARAPYLSLNAFARFLSSSAFVESPKTAYWSAAFSRLATAFSKIPSFS